MHSGWHSSQPADGALTALLLPQQPRTLDAPSVLQQVALPEPASLLVGVIAKLLMPGKDPGGWIISILLGLGGSLVAGWMGRSLGWYGDGEAAGFIMSVVGAVLILFVYRLLSKKKS